MKLGLQMFSLGQEIRKDMIKAIELVGKIGYDGVELSGYGGLSPKEMKQLVADNGMEIAASHVHLPEEKKDQEAALEYAAEAGIPKLIIPFMENSRWFPTTPTFRDTLQQVKEYVALATKYNIQIGYHNHGHELMEFGGKSVLDHIADNTPDNFLLEVDCYWVEFGEKNAYKFIQRHADKATTICHYKQMLEPVEKANTTLDKGYIDFKKISDLLKANNGEWAIIEQEPGSVEDLVEAAKINHDFARSIL